MKMQLAGYWTALGVAFIVAQVAQMIASRGARMVRRDLGKRAMKKAYVHAAPDLGGGFIVGRAVHQALYLPMLSLVSTVAITVFPKYWDPMKDEELYHLFNTPFYVGLAASYVCTVLLLGQYYAARRRGCHVGRV